MPALQANSASCHTTGAGRCRALDARRPRPTRPKISDGIGTVVEAKYMPPWPASDVGVAAQPLEAARPEDARRDREVVQGRRPARRRRRRRRSRRRRARRARRRASDVVMKMPEAYTGSLTQPERLPVLRARPAHHQAHVHDRLRGDPGQPDGDPPRADLPHRPVAGRGEHEARRQGRQARMELLHRPVAAVARAGPHRRSSPNTPQPSARAAAASPASPASSPVGCPARTRSSTPSTPASCCSPATRSCSRSTTTTTPRRRPTARRSRSSSTPAPRTSRSSRS